MKNAKITRGNQKYENLGLAKFSTGLVTAQARSSLTIKKNKEHCRSSGLNVKDMRPSIRCWRTCKNPKLHEEKKMGKVCPSIHHLMLSMHYKKVGERGSSRKEETLCSASAENKDGCNLFSADSTDLSSLSRSSTVKDLER